MSYAFGRRNNPAWDALRVQSMNRLGGLLSDNQTPGLGLTNSIYVWHADGSDLGIYDPDEAGLLAALVVAVSGDTVWLPSVPITLTAGITIPAGVALVGISHDAQLNASGFNGTAITLSDNSICCNFAATMQSDGATSVLFNATASGSRLDRIRGIVSGGSSSNTGATTGSIETALETWLATASAIYYSSDYFDGGQPVWNKVATIPAVTLEQFVIAHDGSVVYVRGIAAGVRSIWSCANPKAASPTWSAIATNGDTIGGYVITIDSQISINNTTLVTLLYRSATGNRYYAEYSGSWALSLAANDYAYQSVYQYELTIHSAGLDSYQLILANPYGVVNSWSGAIGGGWSSAWRNQIGGNVYIVTTSATSGNDIRNASANSICLNLPNPSGSANNYTVTGAIDGAQVYVTGYAGSLYLSDDGSTFVSIGSGWGPGWVYDAILSGGGELVWILKSIPNGNVPTRLYNRDGTVLRDMTGNFWSLTSGDQIIINAGVVYP